MLLPATTIAWNGLAVLIEGPPGCGKSTLAMACLDHGAELVADDQTLVTSNAGTLTASAPPTIRGCLAIREVGVFRVRVRDTATPAMILSLAHHAPGWSSRRLGEASLPILALPIGYPCTPPLLHHLVRALSAGGDVWLEAEDFLPIRGVA